MRTTCWSSSLLAALALVTLPLALGCQSHGGLSNGGSDGIARSGGTTGGPDASGGAGSGGKGGSGGIGGSTTGGSTTTCYVDSPCQFAYRCTRSGYQRFETEWDCHSVCGPGPCSGATCRAVGSETACPTGTRCLGDGANDITRACQPVDGGGADSGDACNNDACVGDCTPSDYQCQGSAMQRCNSSGLWETVATCPDTCSNGQCIESCVAGQQRCKDLVPQTCSAAGLWQDNRACLYLCSAGTCTGECPPGSRRCRENTAQTCSNEAVWVDQQTCTGSSPTCAGGQCVSSCLGAGQDCTDPNSSCCQGSECVSSTDSMTFIKTVTCRTVSCTALGKACTASTDCCAGLDCTGGTCVARTEACMEKPEDGVCGGSSSGTCCPGTVCGAIMGSSSLGCAIPYNDIKPQDVSCPRDRPSQHEACTAARFALTCDYYPANEANCFYICTCSYHGWSCAKFTML